MFHKPILLVCLLIAIGVGARAISYHKEAIQKATASVVFEYDIQHVKDVEEQLKTSRALLEDSLTKQRTLTDDKERITADYNKLVNSLRQRPSRNSEADTQPANPPNTCSITGAELSREDGEFLAGEAAAAMKIQKERDYYYHAYTKLEAELNKLNGKD